jgi:hypothetical protein
MIACMKELPSRYGPDSAVGTSQIVVELQELQRRMVRDLERFLSFGLKDPQGAWPRQRNSGRAATNADTQDGPTGGPVLP